MVTHVDSDKTSLITVKTVLDLAKRAKEIYESSKVDEKRQILNFLFSNLEMRDKKAIITLRELSDKLVAVSDHPMCRGPYIRTMIQERRGEVAFKTQKGL